MTLTDARTGLEIIPRDECLRLLGTEEVGRVAVVQGIHPVIFPVNYALHGDEVVFRTAEGTKLTAGRRAPVCFEVDRFDRERRSGWSVVVDGSLDEVTDLSEPGLRERVRRLRLDPWAPGPKEHLVRVVPLRITGRRVAGGQSPAR